MSLIVCTFHRDPITHAVVDDPSPEEPGHDLAGVEAWRTQVWGSPATIRRGAQFLPKLAASDLYVEPDQLAAFAAECHMLLQDSVGLAAELNGDEQAIRQRLENFVWAIERAHQTQGGVYIG